MTGRTIRLADPRMERALAEMQGLIHHRYPDATFRVVHGEDPDGVYLKATIDVENTDEVVDVFIDRLLDLQVEEGLPLYVIPVRPRERIAEMMSENSRARPYGRRRVDFDDGPHARIG